MTTKISTISVILMGLLSWLALGLADFNASYSLDMNIDKFLGVAESQTWQKNISSQPGEFWRHLNPMATLIFTLPVLAVVFLPDSPRGRTMVVALVALLLIVDIFQLLSFEGGDRKGCEGCFALALVHIAFGFLAMLTAAMYSAWFYFSSMGRR